MESELVRALQKLRRKMQTFSPRTLDGAVSVWIKDLDAALAAHDAREGEQIDPVAHGKELAARERLQALHQREQAAQPQPSVADWVMVPRKPTQAMRDALRIGSRRDCPSDELCNVRYAAMLAAAPQEKP